MLEKLPKLIVLLGPTASGKTAWSLQLAKTFNGDITSADSRQVYKKMNIGTAKQTGEWRWSGLRRTFFVEDVPHHLIDFFDPGKTFSAAEFRDKAVKYVKKAQDKGKTPFVVGGTGLYITTLVDNWRIPHIPANKKLRGSLEEKPIDELLALLDRLDPRMGETIDRKNPRRIIRALEVCILTGKPFSQMRTKGEPLFDTLQIGIDVPRDELIARLDKRVDRMMANGLLAEVEKLVKQKYAWHLPSMSGIGYGEFRQYFEKTTALDDVVSAIKKNTRAFAKRQMTWFKRDKRIVWCKTYGEAERLVAEFLRTH